MEIISKISEGIHVDNNEYDQPDNTMRDNRNGIIYDVVSGNYIWKNLKGTLEVLDLSVNDIVMRSCWIRNRYFLFVLNTVSDYFQLKELNFATDGSVSSTNLRWQTTNTIMKMDVDHPIRAMYGYYENEEIQRIYWTDFNNQPRTVNPGNEASITPLAKFINLTPVLDGVYGKIKFTAEISGGTLKAGMHFFAWRLYKDGYYTDWSHLSAPIPVFNGSVGSTFADYHNIEGGAPDEVTSKGLQLTLTDIDSDYNKIQVASFYCNAFNSIAEGRIIYESVISASTIVINYTGSENAGTVTVAELMTTSVLVNKCKDMMTAKKRNIIANIEERAELDVSTVHSTQKNNQMEVAITPKLYTIILDTKAYGMSHLYTFSPLYGILPGTSELAVWGLFSFMYYYAVTNVSYTDGGGAHTPSAGNYFYTLGNATWVSGTVKLAIVIKKYKKPTGTDLNLDYVLDTEFVENEYYNYKNPRIVEKLRGYPGGEKVRLGVLFFDKTGRPFFVRHLWNTVTTLSGMTIGPGDTRVPERYEASGNFPLVYLERYTAGPPQEYYKNTLGFVNYFSISGLDITPIKDQIGSFAIVRCPIERQNLAYGALGLMTANGNDIYPNTGFRADDDDINHYPGAYTFYCPEDIFDFTEFSIQPGDKLVNRYYMTPFDPTEIPFYAGLQGFGTLQTSSSGGQMNTYQKFYIYNSGLGTNNGAINAEHEILFYTKYHQGDGDSVSIDPRDETKLLRYETDVPGVIGNCYTHIANLGVAVLDIDETGSGGEDVKGLFDLALTDPTMLICAIKRENSNPYGGTGDSALASSVYQSTGHYQIVDAGVLADIVSGGNYIFNEIEVFGGDTYVCIWDLLRSMRNEDVNPGEKRFSHTILIPIETRINLDLREGNHVGKDKIHSVIDAFTNGLRWLTGSNKWEEFNYNDGYSSDSINDLYLPLPNNFRLENVFDTRLRYSPEKSYSEYKDSFRRFNALDYYTVDSNFGPVINIRNKFGKIVYWQVDQVGYIPMGERALTSNDFGNAIQLGVSGIFERHDELVEFIGNSNQFGLIESNAGFHWYDAVRKLFITLTNSMQLSQDSIVKGLDSYFINTVPNNMDSFDNPGKDYGIVGGYDSRDKMVYMTLRTSAYEETIGMNIKTNKFVGYFDFKSMLYFNFRDYLYSVDDTLKKVYQHGTGTIGSYHGVTKDRYFTIIIKENSNIAKLFETYEIIGNDKFFSTMDFTLEDASTVKEYFTGANSVHLAQRLKYRNRRWAGNFPKISRERLVGGYVKVTFTDSGSDELKFLEMKSSYQKMM